MWGKASGKAREELGKCLRSKAQGAKTGGSHFAAVIKMCCGMADVLCACVCVFARVCARGLECMAAPQRSYGRYPEGMESKNRLPLWFLLYES